METDGQTDGQTITSLDRVCIPCSAVKTKTKRWSNKKVRKKYTERRRSQSGG